MAWSDVANKLKFYTVPTEKADILAALEDLYDDSATARAMLDGATAGEDIWLMKSINGSSSRAGTGTAKIDPRLRICLHST